MSFLPLQFLALSVHRRCNCVDLSKAELRDASPSPSRSVSGGSFME